MCQAETTFRTNIRYSFGDDVQIFGFGRTAGPSAHLYFTIKPVIIEVNQQLPECPMFRQSPVGAWHHRAVAVQCRAYVQWLQQRCEASAWPSRHATAFTSQHTFTTRFICCICLEQSAGVSTGIAVTASFLQQTEDRAFCPVVQQL